MSVEEPDYEKVEILWTTAGGWLIVPHFDDGTSIVMDEATSHADALMKASEYRVPIHDMNPAPRPSHI